MRPFVSVIIPVFNDAKRLKDCLEALAKQTYPAEAYEVIVVDNGSDSVVQGYYSKPQAPRSTLFLHEPIRGLHRARNTGITAAKGEIFAFTDADCIPAQDWLEKGAEAVLKEPGTGLAAGKIEVFPINADKPTSAELFEMATAFPQKQYIEKWHFGAPANVFTTKQVIDKVGIFDGALQSGADVEWGSRVYKAGFKLVYSDDAIVSHPARRTLKELCNKHRRVIGGLHDIRKKEGYQLKSFVIDLKDDWPQSGDFRGIFSGKVILGFGGKLKVFAVMICVKAARIIERIRLYSGGASRWA